jgi:hypothetical protein
MTASKIERLVAGLHKQGVTSRRVGAGGHLLYLPGGATATVHTSPSDHRAMKNLRSKVERAGLTWPGTL